MYNKVGSPSVIGRASDVQTVRYLYGWLRREVDRLAERDCRGNGRSWANNYRLGVVDTISHKFYEQAEATRQAMRAEAALLAQNAGQSTSLALVRINNAIARVEKRREEVEAWTKAHVALIAGRSSGGSYDPSARRAGQMAGREIRMRPAKASLQ